MEITRYLSLLIAILICSLQDSLGIDAPENVTVTNEGSTDSLRVTWDPPVDVIDHVVTWSPPDNTGTSSGLGSEVAEYTITGLTPGTLYNVTVTARNGTNDTMDETGQGRTIPSAVILMEPAAMNDSISAQWTKPDGAVDQYLVLCSDGTADPPSPIMEDVSATYQASCTGLSTAGADYNITVTSQSGMETSTDSYQTITALPNAVQIIAGDSTNSSYQASWNHPEGEIDSFQVFCYENDTMPEEITNVTSANVYEVTCESLPTAGTGYQFSVVSVSGDKNATSQTMLFTIPNPVDLMEGESTVDSVSASWNRPAGEVTSYEIGCSEGDSMPPSVDQTGDGPFSASCENLTNPGDLYTISVTSLSNGERSDVATIPLRALPSAVTNLTESGATNDSVSATWTKPSGEVSGYNVTCPDKMTVPEDASTLTVTCDGLQTAGAGYTIKVVAVSGSQSSDPATVNITAYPNVVSLSADPITTTHITVMWDDPEGEEDSFIVDCGADGSTDFTVLPDNPFQATCDVPMAGADFNITVTSVSGDKESPVTNTFTSDTPDQVTITSMTSDTTSITVTWNVIPSADGFRVTCSEGSPSPSSPLPGTATQVTCEGVTSGRNHSVSIVTMENDGESLETVTYVVAVPLSVNLTAGSSLTTSVSAMWPYPGGLIDIFRVDCSNGTESNATLVVDQGLDTSYLVRCDEVWNPGDNYTMVVTSVSNEQENSASILLTALPLSVDLVASNSTTSSVSATWQFPGGIVEEFEVECSNGTESNATLVVEQDLNTNYLVRCDEVRNPGDNYTMVVTSVSNEQENSASIVLTALPLSVDLVANDSTTSSVSATWQFPGGIVEEFEVECSNGTESNATFVVDQGLVYTSYLVRCDEVWNPGDNYTMVVTSVSNQQENSASIVLTALPLSVNLVASNSTISSVSATWQSPGGIVEEFEVDCSNGTESNVTSVVDQGLDTSYLVRCDEVWNPGDNYTMVVTSVSNEQENSASIVLTALPLSVELVASNSTTSSVSATWQFLGGIVEGFEVKCSSGNTTTYTVQDTGYLASCENLETPGDNYTMTVTSLSNGQRNSALIVLTALPLSVELVASNSTTSSVSATWQFPGGIVEEFEVECSNGTESNATFVVDQGLVTSYLVRCDEVWNPGDNYTMVVTSVSNQQENSASIILTALPLSVNLVVSNSTISSVSATWQSPGGIVEEFEVDCSNGTESNATLVVDQGLDTSYLVRCDEVWNPGDNYTMVVTSVSNQQENSASIVLTALPLSVELVASNSTTSSVSATWQFPEGIVEGFEVKCSSGNATTYTVQDTGYLASCENLETPGDNYTMTVTSLSNGQRNSASIVLTALPEAVMLGEVEDMVTTNSITASWSNATGVVEYYEVTCSDNGTASPDRVNPTDDLIASCTGLPIPGDNYIMSVTTVSNGQISVTDTITITALPSAVTLLEGPSNNTAISATWTIPGSIVDTFDITCSNGTASPSSITVATSPTTDTFKAYCTGLRTPGLEYDLTVVAISNNKQSASRTVGVHASPASVALIPGNSTTTTVNATWMKPESAVEHYVIECSNGTASPATIEDTSEPSYSASCINLPTPGDTYTMTVTSFVDNGNTSTSSYIDLTALPEAVTLLTEERDMVTTDSITASWGSVIGVFDYYEVSCSAGTASPAQVNPTDVLMASCTGLQTPGDNYTMSVTTFSNGQRSALATITITAYPAPVVLTAGPITTTQITVLWNDTNGEEDSYKVDCGADGSTDFTLLSGAATFEATCNATAARADYNITVTSVSGDKESPVTNTFTAATPDQVAVVDMSSNTTSITVIWNAIPSADGFRVNCFEGTPSPSSSLPGTATQVTCVNVTSGGNHSVSIVTLENNGESAETVDYVVAVPLNADLAADNSTTTSVSAMWPYPGRLVDIFRVDCSNGTASNAALVVDQVPLSVNLTAGSSLTTSVSAMWPYPGGLVDIFRVECSNGTESNATLVVAQELSTSYLVRCDEVWNPGDNYTMVVTSVSNELENPASIVLTALPLSVQLVASDSTTNSVSATWQFPGGIVEEFELECSNGTGSTDSNEDDSASCEDLDTPGDNYTMTVTSLSNGQRNSAPIVLTALPEAVELTEASADVTTSSISATWNMPNGVVEYYDVSCSDGYPSPARFDSEDDLIASCENLTTPGDDYDISVTAVSNGQLSAISTITITALPEAVVLSKGDSNTTVISATWTVPSSVVDAFNITCSEGTASPSSIPVSSSQAGEQFTAYCIELPSSGEEYVLTVVAISNNKLSAPSTVSVFALPLGVDLEEGPSTINSVNATWMRQNDTVESYRIACSQGDASPSTIVDTDQESFSASCVNLPGPGATYGMTVFSEVGTNTTSNSTRASSFIQLVAVPESVETISVAEYNTTAVNVEWQLKTCSECVYIYFILTFEPDSQDPIRVDYTSGNVQYFALVPGLTQGRNYSFTVVSVSGVGVEGATLKTSEEQSVEQRTEPASTSRLDITADKRTLSLTWERAVGDSDDYNISVTPNHGTAVFNGSLNNPAGLVSGLTPGMMYEVAVVTISGAERSEPATGTERTLPDTPSQVQNSTAEVMGINTITLTYETPAEPNGDIESYMISYVGTREDNANHEFASLYDAVLTVTFTDLYPGFSYTFTITAVNDGGFESEPASTNPVVTDEEVPEPVPEDYAYTENTVVPAKSTTTFTVELPNNLFSQDNGQLQTFSVIITTEESDASIGSTNLTYAQAQEMREGGITPSYITKAGIQYPFTPSFGSSRKRRATEAATVVVGDGTCSRPPIEYCNGRLSDDTVYYYAFRAYNSEGGVTSGVFGPVKTVKDNTLGIALGVSFALLVIAAVVVVGVFLMKRREKGTSQRPSLDGSDNPGFAGPDQEMRGIRRKTGSSMHRKSNSKPVLLNNFEDHYKRMKADSDFRFTEEYDEIRQVGKDQPIVAATDMVNRAKNRFTNILPYEHSRVKLAALADEPDTDYINANYMPGYNSPREFIACQGPLPGTLDDMWRMVWEKNTSIIVMLTQLVEKGKIKCHQYWPEDYNSVTYGSIEVSLQAEQQYEHWVIREFTLVKGEEIRKITQYHFMSWPDHGVPNLTCTMLDFVRTVRETIQKQASDHPVIAHCSAGVGRTGTYIALDRLMQFMQENDFIDIFGIICEMRMQRNHMVQTEKQYIFIHECVTDLMQREDDTGESIYVNLRSNGYNHEDQNENLLDQAV